MGRRGRIVSDASASGGSFRQKRERNRRGFGRTGAADVTGIFLEEVMSKHSTRTLVDDGGNYVIAAFH